MSSLYRPYPAKPWNGIWVILLLPLVVVMLVLFILLSSARGGTTISYELTPTEMVIHYGGGPTFTRSAITDVQVIKPVGIRRVAGASLPGLQTGWWSLPGTGRIRLFATTLDSLTVVRAGSDVVGISPADPEGFRRALDSGAAGTFPAAVYRGSRLPGAVPLFWLLLPLVLVGLVACALGTAPRRMRYLLDGNGLVITLGWLHKRIPYGSITDIRVESPSGSPGRLWGSNMPGFFWGKFVWKQAGANLMLYGTRTRPIVLIGTERATYGITPDDSESFVADLRRRLG